MGVERFLSADGRNLRPSAIRAFARLINDPNVISFAGGSPSPATFPAERLAGIAERVIRDRREVSAAIRPYPRPASCSTRFRIFRIHPAA